MWNSVTFRKRYLGSRDLNSLVDLNGIAVDDFAVEAQRDCNSQFRFSGRSRADNGNDVAQIVNLRFVV